MNRFLYDNKIKFRVSRHILFFLLTVFAFTAVLYVQKGNESFPDILWLTFINALFFFSYAYLTIFLLIPEFLLKRKILWFLVLFSLVGIGLSAIKLVVSDQIFYAAISPENIQRSGFMNLRFIVVNTKDMTFIVAMFCIAKYIKDYLYSERYRKELEVQTREAQRKLFQSQFDPHFMFNTINNLYALSLLNPVKTNEVITRIKTVLNYIIEEIQKEYVELENEVALVENFIQLEKLRYGKRLKVDFNIEGEIHLFKIPPLILFIMVENCFKHGSSLDAGTPWIKIDVIVKSGRVHLSAENSKPKTKIKRKSELNVNSHLLNLRKRLKILYSPNGYNFIIRDTEKSFKVQVELKEEIEFVQNKYR